MSYESVIRNFKFLLNQSLNQKSVIIIYPDKSVDYYIAGIVCLIISDSNGDNDIILLNNISPYGSSNGDVIVRLSPEIKIVNSGKEIDRLEKLKSINELSITNSHYCNNKYNLLLNIHLAYEKNKCVSVCCYIENEKKYFTGKVLEIKDEFFKVKQYDKYGQYICEYIINMIDVYVLFYDTIIEKTFDKILNYQMLTK